MSSRRTFTKRLTLSNTAAAWVVVGISIPLGAADVVVPTMSALIVGLYAAYTGTGVMDYRTSVRAPVSGGGDGDV